MANTQVSATSDARLIRRIHPGGIQTSQRRLVTIGPVPHSGLIAMAKGLLEDRAELEALFDELDLELAAFVMKLYRADPQDRDDLVSLWPLCDFADPSAAAHAFHDAYPDAPVDEFLPDYIADVAGEAAS